MFPLDRMLKSFIKRGELTVIDASGKRHVFSGSTADGPDGVPLKPVSMKVHDARLYHKLVFNPELNMGEAYMDGGVTFEEGSTIRHCRDDVVTLDLADGSETTINLRPIQHLLNVLRTMK